MLSGVTFYHRTTRKLVAAFGTMFNNIKLVRYNKSGTTEIERINVPLTYASKEKFYTRITQDPGLNSQVNIVLPRMSFELTGISYDPLRKNSSFVEQYSFKNSNLLTTVRRIPYNFEFALYLFARNAEDGTQIVEQILPYFTPDYTLSIDLINDPTLKVDVPIVLQSVSQDVEGDVGDSGQTRTIIWTLTFTVKGWIYGPITDSKVIRQVTANTYYDNSADTAGDTQLNLFDGDGNFSIGELIYQGRTLNDSTATAYVRGWDAGSNTLLITDTAGRINANVVITGAVSNTAYNVASYGTPDYQLLRLVIKPDPITANITDPFGYNETLSVAPNIV